jgi:Mg2+ transporter MgtE
MSQIIAWNEVETFGTAVKLKIPHEKIAQLHPADIADIIEQLDPAQRTQVIESLDLETAADMLEETEPEVQRAIIESMDVEKAADIVEEMEPDEAADLLGDLSEARSEELLEHMEAEEAADVKELLAFDEDTAGGMMTTEYVAIPDSLTAADTIDRLRDLHPDAEIIYYIYVVDEDEQLVGVLSLRELIVAQPNMLISDIMEKNAITVHTNSSPEDVAQVMDKYNLLAVPVVDMENRLRGIVTVDDTLSTLVPQLRRHRQQQGSQG